MASFHVRPPSVVFSTYSELYAYATSGSVGDAEILHPGPAKHAVSKSFLAHPFRHVFPASSLTQMALDFQLKSLT